MAVGLDDNLAHLFRQVLQALAGLKGFIQLGGQIGDALLNVLAHAPGYQRIGQHADGGVDRGFGDRMGPLELVHAGAQREQVGAGLLNLLMERFSQSSIGL